MKSLAAKAGLDFVVIGASKCGTTSLFEYLRRHPRIYLPPSKDAPFLAADDWTPESWPVARAAYFSEASPEALWGTVTPRYMEDPRIPDRLACSMPRARLLALLRDPVTRALSQYRQQVRRGKETRSFHDVVTESLSVGRSNRQKRKDTTEERYLRPGEYGRALSAFRQHFGADQLLALFTEDLRVDPGGVLDRIMTFLGLDSGFRPDNLSKLYHRGGTRERFPRLVGLARRVSPVRAVWRLVPVRHRRVLWYWYFTRVNVVAEPEPRTDPEIQCALRDYYRADTILLTRLLGKEPPWNEPAL